MDCPVGYYFVYALMLLMGRVKWQEVCREHKPCFARSDLNRGPRNRMGHPGRKKACIPGLGPANSKISPPGVHPGLFVPTFAGIELTPGQDFV